MDQEETIKFLEEMFSKENECSERGHPFDEEIILDYQGRAFPQVFVRCTGCESFYERMPTDEEIRYYNSNWDLQVTI
jgi:antirestriction protein